MGFTYIKDGKVCTGNLRDNRSPAMVNSKAELDLLTDTFPGMIAHTAGYKDMWQLNADGEWVAIIETEG